MYQLQAPVRLRIAVLADFHNTDPGPALAMLAADVPDLIAIPGDMLEGDMPRAGESSVDGSAKAVALLEGCAKTAPTFVSLGNHEWAVDDGDLEQLRQTGVTLLDNGWVPFQQVLIGGLSSGRVTRYRAFRENRNRQAAEAGGHIAPAPERYPFDRQAIYAKEPWTENDWLAEFEQQEGYRILLSHHPEYWSMTGAMLKEHPIDLVFSGHAHGGQIRVAGRGLFAPGQGILPKYTEGVHQGPFGRMIISRGMSNPQFLIPRWGNPREILYVELAPYHDAALSR